MSVRQKIVATSLVLVIALLVACAPKAAPVPAPQAAASAPAVSASAAVPIAPAKPAWQIEWERVLAEAKKEGTVVASITFGGQQRQLITNPFTSEYRVRIETMSGGASLLAPKIFAEQRAGIYSGDVWISGSTTYRELEGALDNLDPVLILPELTEPELIKKTWYFGELGWADKAHTSA